MARRRQKFIEPNAPQAELAQRYEGVERETVIPGSKRAPGVSTHRLLGAIERYKDDFSAAGYNALVRAKANALAATSSSGLVSNYGGGTGGGGKRSGGVADHQRLAYAETVRIVSHLPAKWRPMFYCLIEDTAKITEIGKWRLPGARDPATLRGAGRAFVADLADLLEHQEILARGATRGEKPHARIEGQIRRERKARRER